MTLFEQAPRSSRKHRGMTSPHEINAGRKSKNL
jgi:hypothetical protein